ncbi:AaceriADL137Wp [[Ashbya] aceris (nom. inval.)]|nr:AaceriADL137Wp [[Ashbya] aceris (nom. inval.)]
MVSLLLCLLLVQLRWSLCSTVLDNLLQQTNIAFLSQRDVMGEIHVNQVGLVGVELCSMFGSVGEGGDVIAEMLQAGVQMFVMDINYDEEAKRWQLCGSMGLGEALSAVSEQIDLFLPTLYTDIVVLALRGDVAAADANSEALRDAIRHIEQWVIPANTVRQVWPQLNNLLYGQERRVFVVSLDEELRDALGEEAYGPDVVTYVKGNDTIDCEDLTGSWKFLERDFRLADVQEYVRCGYSPVITGNSVAGMTDLVALVKAARLWSWAPGEPTTDITTRDVRRCASLAYNSTTQRAAWRATACRQLLPLLCQSADDRYRWQVAPNHFTFEHASYNGVCPAGYKASLPRTALEQRELERYLSENYPSDEQYWIHLNSISVEKCWVVGGPETPCPYMGVVSTRNFAAMIMTSSVLVLCLLVLIILLNLVRVPVQDNRRSWKRALSSYSKAETEGVPM